MNNVNLYVISGTIFGQPERGTYQNMASLKFRLLHENQRKGFQGKEGKLEVVEVEVALFGSMAEEFGASLSEGMRLLIKGRLKSVKGKERVFLGVLAEEIVLLDGEGKKEVDFDSLPF
jgi:single-stranded DNA-binding protein